MKKMKKALFAVLAAFSLSACDFDIQKLPGQVADTVGGWIDSVKDLITGGGEKEKEGEGEKEKEEEQPCEHQDANHDGVCDLCGEQGLVVNHTDANHDHLCDVCGAEVSQCKDDNHDHLCDECGAVLSSCKDNDNDFKCDICGKDLKAVSFVLDYSEATTEFAKDQEFSSEGLKVVVTSEAGSTQEITQLEVSSPDMSEVGEKTVSVSYEFAGEQHADEYKINVTYWSEMDLKVFSAASLTKYCSLPYLPGFNMRVEYELDDEGYLESWEIVADDITEEAFLEYSNSFKYFKKTVEIEGDEVVYSFTEPDFRYFDVEGLYGLSDVQVYSLVPYEFEIEIDEETGEEEEDRSRHFVYDEYFAMGINDEGQLIVKSRKVNSMLDGYFFGDKFADGKYYFPAEFNSYLKLLPKILFYYYSELSQDAFVLPKLGKIEEIIPVSLFDLYPFNENLDQFDLAWVISIPYASQQTYLDYCNSLLAAGYTLSESGAYYLDNDLVGYIQISPSFTAADPEDSESYDELDFQFLYIAPEDYTSRLTTPINELMEKLEINDFEVDNGHYPNYGESDVWFEVTAEDAVEADEEQQIEAKSSELATLEALLAKLQGLGFGVLSEAEESTYGQYVAATAKVTDYEALNITIYVFEPENGKCEVVFEAMGLYSFEDVYAIVFGEEEYQEFSPGYAYLSIEDESASKSGASSKIAEIANNMLGIASIDGMTLFAYSQNTYAFSGLTKDEQIVFTVFIRFTEGTGYEVYVDASELGEFESYVRYIGDSLIEDGAIRNKNYFATNSGYEIDIVEYYKYSVGNAQAIGNSYANTFVNYLGYVIDTEQSDTEATDEGYKVVLSNGVFDLTITVAPTPYSATVNICGVTLEFSLHSDAGEPNA